MRDSKSLCVMCFTHTDATAASTPHVSCPWEHRDSADLGTGCSTFIGMECFCSGLGSWHGRTLKVGKDYSPFHDSLCQSARWKSFPALVNRLETLQMWLHDYVTIADGDPMLPWHLQLLLQHCVSLNVVRESGKEVLIIVVVEMMH